MPTRSRRHGLADNTIAGETRDHFPTGRIGTTNHQPSLNLASHDQTRTTANPTLSPYELCAISALWLSHANLKMTMLALCVQQQQQQQLLALLHFNTCTTTTTVIITTSRTSATTTTTTTTTGIINISSSRRSNNNSSSNIAGADDEDCPRTTDEGRGSSARYPELPRGCCRLPGSPWPPGPGRASGGRGLAARPGNGACSICYPSSCCPARVPRVRKAERRPWRRFTVNANPHCWIPVVQMGDKIYAYNIYKTKHSKLLKTLNKYVLVNSPFFFVGFLQCDIQIKRLHMNLSIY